MNKQILTIIIVFCLFVCGCSNNDWKSKIEITDTIYTSTGIQLKIKSIKNEKYDNVCIKVNLTQEKTGEKDTIKYCNSIDYGVETTFFFDTDIKDIYQGINYEIETVTIDK